MKNIFISRTAMSPEVDFRFTEHKLHLTGEAYPENANEFFHPILKGLESYLKNHDGQTIEFHFKLTYFNSAATKMLYKIFELLNESASKNNRIILNWFHDEEDDTIQEFGEGVKEDFMAIEFCPVVLSAA